MECSDKDASLLLLFYVVKKAANRQVNNWKEALAMCGGFCSVNMLFGCGVVIWNTHSCTNYPCSPVGNAQLGRRHGV